MSDFNMMVATSHSSLPKIPLTAKGRLMLLLALTLLLLAVALLLTAITTGNAIVISVSSVLVCLGLLAFVTYALPLFRRRESALVTTATPDQNNPVRLAPNPPLDKTGLEMEKEQGYLNPYMPEEPDTSKEETIEEFHHLGRQLQRLATSHRRRGG
jgi:hypothetical protein